jgi:hypothetical protein
MTASSGRFAAIGLALFAAAGPAAGAEPAGSVCLPSPPAAGVGTADPFHVPAPKATELNTAAKALYRQGKWEEARTQSRAALAADPDFLAPRLNIACSFVRQERFAEATAEARALLERAYVPWAREVLEAADMGALKVRPEMKEFRASMAESARKWGGGLDASLVFVARQRPPLRVPPTGEGVFILNPHQEVYAFIPETGLFRQLTAEDGRVIALARSSDGRRITYVTAEKLVRGSAPKDLALRGVVVSELVLGTMTASAPIRLEGDVRKLDILETPGGFVYRVSGDRLSGAFRRGAADVLVPFPKVENGRGTKSWTRLTPDGAISTSSASLRAGCAAAEERVGADRVHTLTVHAHGRPPRRLGETLGAGFAGLPLP